MEENRSHSEKCRKRIEEQLRKTEDGMRKLKEQESRRKAAEERKESDRAAVSGCTKGNEEKHEAKSSNRGDIGMMTEVMANGGRHN